MSRVRTGRVRLPMAAMAAAAMLVTMSTPAGAQMEPKQPVITSAPKAVDYNRNARIAGRLEGGMAGDRVRLQRHTGTWKTIAARDVREDGTVGFLVENLKHSAAYRFLHVDATTGERTVSDRRRIAVVARLRVHTTKDHLMRGRRTRVYGSLFPKAPGRTVLLQQKVSGEWRGIDRLPAGDGFFSTYFRPSDPGFRRLRVRFGGDEDNRRASARSGIRVYEPDLATWYGPGFYGNRTACGKTLGYDTLGVAHRTLPCGTKVSILFEGRTITVPVIDRGPYSSANWDLTRETAERLRFSGKDTIGTDRH
ncbi:MAG: septal ring lytic transglycosylase RlpA family protein [Actinomycetota bacterium]